MLTSPITITIDGVAQSLALINQDNFGAVYRKRTATDEYTLQIRHTYEGKVGASQVERSNVDLSHTTWDANGSPVVTQVYAVIRTPRNVDPDRVSDEVVGFDTFLSANVAAIVGWQS